MGWRCYGKLLFPRHARFPPKCGDSAGMRLWAVNMMAAQDMLR